MASAEELRSIIQKPITEAVPQAIQMAIGMFNKQQGEADARVGKEMAKLAKRYVSVLQGITGLKTGWVVSPTAHLLSIDNDDGGITIDIHWEMDIGSGKADITVELNRRTGPEGPGAKWRSKFHLVKGVKPDAMNLSPTKVITDAAVRKFLKEEAGNILTALFEGEWIEEAVETAEIPPGRPKFVARKIIHPQDQKEYGGGKAIRAVKMGNNSNVVARLKVKGGNYMGFGVKFHATLAMPKTLADAGYDVWHVGREGGMDTWVALRPKGIKMNKGARRASWSAYGEPWHLETWAKEKGIELGPKSRFQGEGVAMGMGPGGKCVCPKCGNSEEHVTGEACIDKTCSKCGVNMIREEDVHLEDSRRSPGEGWHDERTQIFAVVKKLYPDVVVDFKSGGNFWLGFSSSPKDREERNKKVIVALKRAGWKKVRTSGKGTFQALHIMTKYKSPYGEDSDVNAVLELRSIIERKARTDRSPKWMDKTEKKGAAKKKERKHAKREIAQQMRGEETEETIDEAKGGSPGARSARKKMKKVRRKRIKVKIGLMPPEPNKTVKSQASVPTKDGTSEAMDVWVKFPVSKGGPSWAERAVVVTKDDSGYSGAIGFVGRPKKDRMKQTGTTVTKAPEKWLSQLVADGVTGGLNGPFIFDDAVGDLLMDYGSEIVGPSLPEETSFADDLRSIIERKGGSYERSGHSATMATYAKDERKTGRKKEKKAASKSMRQSQRKEIAARMRGEDASLDDMSVYLELVAEELQEAMLKSVEPIRPTPPTQLRNLKTILDTADQLGRFSAEFTSYLKRAMKSEEVDISKLGRFGRQVDAAHKIFKDTYRQLALGYREETEDDEAEIEESIVRIGGGSSLEWNKVISALDPALKAMDGSVRHLGANGRLVSAHDPDWRLEVEFIQDSGEYKFGLFRGFRGNDLVKAGRSNRMGGVKDAVKMAKEFSKAITKLKP